MKCKKKKIISEYESKKRKAIEEVAKYYPIDTNTIEFILDNQVYAMNIIKMQEYEKNRNDLLELELQSLIKNEAINMSGYEYIPVKCLEKILEREENNGT